MAINNISNALGTAVMGLNRQADRVTKDTADLNAALVASQNQLAAGLARNSAGTPDTPALAGETFAASTDIIAPLVDLIQARTAYAVSAKATKITADVEQSTVDMLGHRTTKV